MANKIIIDMNIEQYNYINNIRVTFMSRYLFSNDTSTWFACLFALESNYGTSNLSLYRCNHCSMKVPRVRISIAQNFNDNSGEIWASYASLSDCILDFVLWLQYQKPSRFELDRPNLLYSYFRKYCPEKDYIDKINLIYSHFKNYNHE